MAASASGLLRLDTVPLDGPGGELFREALAAVGLAVVTGRVHERARLMRRPEPRYLDHLGSHHQREANRLGRRLADTLGAPVEVSDRSGDPEAVEEFLRLEATGWKGREGTAMACLPGDAAFFRALCTRFHHEGRLQLLGLQAGEKTVAMKCNLAAGDGLFCFKIAQDDAFNRFSPGVRLERENVLRFHTERTERWMDSCAAADNTMINRLWTERRRLASVVVGRRDLRRGLTARGARAALTVRDRRRATPTP